MNLAKLSKPIQPSEIEWRVITKPKDGKITVAPYIDSRCVMRRLDEEFGPLGWSSSISITNDYLVAEIKVHHDGLNVSKQDGVKIASAGDNDNIDPIKTAVSDALKRVAVQYGLSRDLYEYPIIQVQTTDKYLPYWAKQKLGDLVNAISKGEFKKEYILISQDTPVTSSVKPTTNGKPELDGLKFAKMLAAVNEGKWRDVEQAIPKYTIPPEYEKALRAQIDAVRSGKALEETEAN